MCSCFIIKRYEELPCQTSIWYNEIVRYAIHSALRERTPLINNEEMARRFILKADTNKPAPQELTIDYASQLNAQQLAAVMAPGGPYLVIAGAGAEL